MMKGIRYIFVLGLFALLPACSDDVEQAIGNSQPLPMKFTIGELPTTRATDGLNKDKLSSGTYVTVAVDGNEYVYEVSSDGTTLECIDEVPPYFPLNSSGVSIKAFAPESMSGVGFATKNRMRMTIKSAQSSDASYISSDAMLGAPSKGWSGLDANGKVKPTELAIPLTFKHLMAKIVVNVTPNDTETSKIKKVEVRNIKPKAMFNTTTGVADSAHIGSSDRNYVTLYSNSTGTNAALTVAAVIPPQTVGKGTQFIVVNMGDRTLYYNLPDATEFEGGHVYTYNVGTGFPGTNDMISLSDTLFTYNTSAQGPTITLKRGTTTLTQGTDYDFDTSSQNTATNAGTYTVKVKFKGRYCGTAQKTWKIDRINPTYTAPSTYRIDTAPTTAQNLVKAGSCSISGCTVQYSLGTASAAGTSWSSTVPQKKDEGEYYVWWRIYSTSGNYNTLNGLSPLLARIRKSPGQVICSDGTICEYSQRGSKTPVAVVVRWGSDTGNSKYTQGLAMALKDAGSGSKLKWSTEQVQRNPVQFTSGEPVENEYGGSYKDSPYNTSTYPAFQKALAYSPAAPSNTSGWFLPSAWQFNEVIWGMGTDSETRYNNLRQFFSSRGGTDMNDNSDYWTTSESGKDNAIRFVFKGAGKAGYWGTSGKTNTNYVRPMLAF